MIKTLKIITIISLASLFIGCSKEVIYVDANGTIISKFETVTPNIVCDNRGYAFYQLAGWGATYTLTPVLQNFSSGTYQVKCNEL